MKEDRRSAGHDWRRRGEEADGGRDSHRGRAGVELEWQEEGVFNPGQG
jgi:hypothetical protein